MRKEVVIISVVLLLCMSVLVSAQVDPTGVERGDNSNSQPNPGDLGQDLQEATKNIADPGSVREKINDVLDQEIEIPENLQFFARIIFGLREDSQVNLQLFIILTVIWVVVLLLVKSMIEIIPGFGDELKSWVGGLIVTLLIAISGGLLLAANLIFEISSLFGLLEEWGILQLLISVVLLVGFLFVIGKLIKIIKVRNRIDDAEHAGNDIAYARAYGRATRESMKN